MAQSLSAPKSTTAKVGRKPRQAPKSEGKDAAGIGHNAEPLTEEEQEALQLHHELKIRAQQKKADVAKASYDLERNAANDMVKVACGELKVPATEFRAYMEDKNLSETEYRQKATTRALLRKRGGMPDINGQYALDLPTKADTADESQSAYEDGLRAGRRADDPVPPKHISGIFQTRWMEGWHAGQTENAAKLGLAEQVIARRAAPKVEPKPEADPEADVAAQARKLRAGGFLERTDEPEEAAA